MTGDEVVTGRYAIREGTLIPDASMTEINDQLARMRLLADIGDGVPSFYLDAETGSYWECSEFEDYRKELRRVDRHYIETNFPTVDPDRPL
jgi:hypothetical protein